MKAKSSPKNVNITVGGNVSGHIVVGDHNLVIGGVYGGVVNLITPEKQPTISSRTKPVYLRPRPFSGLLDREAEQKTAIQTLQITESLSVSGEDGIGKTAFMRYLCYNSPGDNFPDGIIYHSANGYGVDDLKQYIFESFFESDTAVKPTEAQISRALQGLHALILLDDLALSFADVTQLINSVPQSSFIFASSTRCLWGEGTCIELCGLPLKDALTLLEHELGHTLNEQDKPTAEKICREVNGNPLMVMQAAGLFHHGIPFAEILRRQQTSKDQFIEDTLTQLNASQRQALYLLAAAQGQPIPAKHLAALLHEKDLENTLKKLFELRLIQAHSPAYSLTGTLALTLGKTAEMSSWEERLLSYFVGWVKQNPPLPDITDVLNLSLKLLEKANREHRWDDVIALGKGIEQTLCTIKRWEAWLQVLNWILKATQALGNRSLEGWALHQLGTRELCLGNLDPARQILTQALNIRNALGDKAGAAVTQHNLNLIIAPPAPPRDTPRSGPKPAPKGGGSSTLKLFLTLTVVAVTAIAIIFGPDLINPPNEPEPNPVVTVPPNEPPPTKKPPTQKPPTQKPPTKIPTTSKPPTIPPTITITPSLTATPCRFGVWYCEDFEDQNARYWDLAPAWSIQKEWSGYVLAGSGHQWASLTEYEWDNFRVRFDLRLQRGTIHLNYRIMPDSTGIVRYYVGVAEKYIYLQKSQYGGGWVELASVDHYFSLNEWHTVEIAGWGNHLAIYIDGEMVMQYVDNGAYLPSGSIAFETLDDSSAQIDNIEVMEPGKEPAGLGWITIITPDILHVSCTSTYITWEENTDRPGMDYWTDIYSDPIDNVLFTAQTCQQKCNDDPACMAFTYDNYLRQCWLKNGKPDPVYKIGDTSGVRECK